MKLIGKEPSLYIFFSNGQNSWINSPERNNRLQVYIRLRAAPIFSQSVEREAKKKERVKIGDEASGSEARKNEGLPA